jgi:YfiH family protein
LGFSVNNIIYAHQKHTDNILICGENFLNPANNINLPLPDDYIYDAMVTDIPGILLSVRSADCIPILFWDEAHNAVGAAHCGWRGTAQKLQIKTALKMRELYNTDLSKLKAAIGPGISKCCYEVSKDFFDNFVSSLGGEAEAYFIKNNRCVGEPQFCRVGFPCPTVKPHHSVQSVGHGSPTLQFTDRSNEKSKKNDKYYCDLKGLNKMLLEEILLPDNITVSKNCTYCEENLFFSHRRQGEYRGTHAAFIGIKKQ